MQIQSLSNYEIALPMFMESFMRIIAITLMGMVIDHFIVL